MNHKVEISNIYSRIEKQHRELSNLLGNLDKEDQSAREHILNSLIALSRAMLHLELI